MVTTAFVGAGVVALGAAGLPDAKAVDPSAMADLQAAAASSQDIASRAADAERASRDSTRGDTAATMVDTADIWMLPLTDYTFSSPYGVQYGKLHGGIDLAAAEGTPYRAIHAGTVTKAGWYGGYGNVVIVAHKDGTEAIYGHSAKLLVKEGQQVKAGEEIGLVGSTGHAYGTQLHLELHVNGSPIDPIPWLRDKGVDIKLQVEAIYSDAAAS